MSFLREFSKDDLWKLEHTDALSCCHRIRPAGWLRPQTSTLTILVAGRPGLAASRAGFWPGLCPCALTWPVLSVPPSPKDPSPIASGLLSGPHLTLAASLEGPAQTQPRRESGLQHRSAGRDTDIRRSARVRTCAERAAWSAKEPLTGMLSGVIVEAQ